MANFDTPEGLLQYGLIASLLQGRKGDNIGGLLMNFANTQEQIKSRKQQQALMQSRLQQEQAELQRKEQERQQIAQLAQQSFAPPQALDPRQQEGGQQMIPGGGGMEQFARGMMGIDPMRAMQFMPKPKMQIAPNGQVVDMNSVQPGQNFAPVPDWQNPAYQAFALRKAKAGASNVTVDSRQESEFAKKMGANFAENYNGILTSGANAANELRDLQRFENIVSRVPTGKLEPLKAEVAKLARGLGVQMDPKKMESMGFQEALEGMSNQFALTLRNPGSGAGMPGALSDKDRDFLVSMVPGLAKTPEGNRIIIEGFKRVAKRKAEVAQLAREYKRRTGKFDDGFYDVLEQRYGGQDLLGDLYEQASGMGAQNAPVSSGGVLVYDPQTGSFK